MLASQQKPEGESILQTAQFSSFIARAFGCFLILAGVYIAWWSKVWSRARIERDQALIPAVLLRSQLATLRQGLTQLSPAHREALSNIDGSIQVLLSELTDSVLDQNHFLSPTFPNPYGYTVDTAGYTAYLKLRNSKVELLSILVNQGVIPAAAEANNDLTPVQQGFVTATLRNVDALATVTPMPSTDQAVAQINGFLVNLHNQLFQHLAEADVKPDMVAAQTPAREYQVLQLEVQSLSKGVWLLYGLLTTLSGLAVLILNNPGFGVPLDFVFAFFWGFGLPTTIQTLAPGSAATALNIQISKN